MVRIVEDDPAIAQIVESVLGEEGYATVLVPIVEPDDIRVAICRVEPNSVSQRAVMSQRCYSDSRSDAPCAPDRFGQIGGLHLKRVETAAGPAVKGRSRRSTSAPILVVEDDEPIRRILVDVLTQEGYPVLGASNGAAALEYIHQRPPRLILLDMNMPVMDGHAFVAAYRALPGPHAPIVLCTATLFGEALATQLGAVTFLKKPFDVDEVLEAVRTHAVPPFCR